MKAVSDKDMRLLIHSEGAILRAMRATKDIRDYNTLRQCVRMIQKLARRA